MAAAEISEWANLRGAISNIEASRDLVIHRAQMTGGSEETSREIANIMGSTGIASAGGIAGGVGKGGIKAGKDKDTQIWTENKKSDPVSNAYGHWDKHKNEFPEFKNAKQYVEATHNFVTHPPEGTLVKERDNGDTLYYNSATNIFAIKNADGVPRTMFRPDPSDHGYKTNLDYFNAQK